MTGVRIILPLLLSVLVMACSGSRTPATPETTVTVAVTSEVTSAVETVASETVTPSGDLQCGDDTPTTFENDDWTEYQPWPENHRVDLAPIHWATIQLPSDQWENQYESEGFSVYSLPSAGATDNQWSAALIFYGYYERTVRETLGLTWEGFTQENLLAIEDDGDAVPNYHLIRQWIEEPKPLRPLQVWGANPVDLPTVQDHRAEFRYGVSGEEVEGYGMSKRIGPFYYFVRLDICASNRSPDREAIVKKLFDSLANGNYGHYW